MASVTSLDQDMRNLRLSRYTPQAANEVRSWIEQTLGESLAAGDLLEALKDGTALCKLANLVLPSPGIKFKASSMPFIQMENISHFLKACELPPLSMPAHDRFLTVDLYEAKDPAQVLQCLTAFSRQAHFINPSRIRETLGPKRADAAYQSTIEQHNNSQSDFHPRATSPIKFNPSSPTQPSRLQSSTTGGSNSSQGGGASRFGAPVSSWSKRADEGVTLPAWNIHQYGYMGGASQGNQGVSFGSRRQIISQAPDIPSLAEKERKRKEKLAEDERLRQLAEEAENRRRVERDAEEERERVEEERRWEVETQRLREDERQRLEDQKQKWAEQERQWKEEEEARRRVSGGTSNGATTSVGVSSNVLRGQSLSEYQREQSKMNPVADKETPDQIRVRELEKQLEEARERERQYQAEREERLRTQDSVPKSRPLPTVVQEERPQSSHTDSEASWVADEREVLRNQWQKSRDDPPSRSPFHRPVPALPTSTSRALPQTVESIKATQPEVAASPPAQSRDTLSSETNKFSTYSPAQRTVNRTDDFLSSNPAPQDVRPRISSSNEAGDTSLEQQNDRDRRMASQTKTKAGGWASKSLLEREMERERERQREWEANQQAQKDLPRDNTQGVGAGQTWDVNQYGYMGKDVDNMNKGSSVGSGINFGGRRQIIGPRSPK